MGDVVAHVSEKPAAELDGKRVVVIFDTAPEHQRQLRHIDLANVPGVTALRQRLEASGGGVECWRAPPCTPHFNLVEYYNRVVRTRATTIRHEPAVVKDLFRAGGLGGVLQHRQRVIEDIILRAVEESMPMPSALAALTSALADVIAANGYLDFS